MLLNADRLVDSDGIATRPLPIIRQELAARWRCCIRTLQRLERRGTLRSRRLPSGRICYLSDGYHTRRGERLAI